MASKTRYTEEFKKKVVEEYKKGDLSLEEVAAKYGLPPALLQDWVNKDDVNNIFISYVERPEEKTSFFTKVKTACVIAFQNLKANGWLLAGCGSRGDRRLTIHRRRYHITIGNKKTATAGRNHIFQRLLILLVKSAKRYHYSV